MTETNLFYELICSQPPEGDLDVLALLMRSCHVIHLDIHSVVCLKFFKTFVSFLPFFRGLSGHKEHREEYCGQEYC